MSEKLASELIAAANGDGGAIKKPEHQRLVPICPNFPDSLLYLLRLLYGISGKPNGAGLPWPVEGAEPPGPSSERVMDFPSMLPTTA